MCAGRLCGLLVVAIATAGLRASWAQTEPSASRPAGGQETPPATQPTTTQEQLTTRPADVGEFASTDLTVEALQARLSQVEAAADLPAATKSTLVDLYRRAVDQANLARTWSSKIEEYQRGREEAPQLLQAVQEQMAAATQPTTAATLEVSPDADLETLTRKLAEAEEQLKQQYDLSHRLEGEANNRASRKQALPDLLTDARQRLERTSQDLLAAPAAGEAPQVLAARRSMLLAQQHALELEGRAYEEELRFYDARSELLSTRREQARLVAGAGRARVRKLRELVSARRQAEVERQAQQAEAELEATPPALRGAAEDNAKLTQERSQLDARIKNAESRTRAAALQNVQLGRELGDLQAIVEQPYMGELLGPRLRKARQLAAELRTYERDLSADKRAFRLAQGRAAEVDDQRLRLADLDARARDELRNLEADRTGEKLERFEPQLKELLRSRRALLESLKQDYDQYSTDLIGLIAAESGLLAKAAEFRGFVEKHVLWVRSAAPLYKASWPTEWRTLGASGQQFLAAWWKDLVSRAALYGGAAVVGLILLEARRRATRRMEWIRERVHRAYSDAYRLTLEALGHTALVTLPLPALLLFLSWRAQAIAQPQNPETYDLARAIAVGLRGAGLVVLTFECIRQLLRPNGLALVHFHWDGGGVRQARRNVLWLVGLLAPLAFVVGMAEYLPDPGWRDSVGRLAAVAALTALALFLARVLHPGRGALARWLKRHETGRWNRMRYVWYPLAVGWPIALAVAAVTGYYYTALALGGRMMQTMRLVFVLVLVHALLIRAVLVAQRRLAIEQARRKRAALLEARAAEGEGGGEVAPIEEEALNLVSIGAQTRQLFRILIAFGLFGAIWFAWSDMLPALSFMGEVRLWAYEVTEVAPDGGAGNVVLQYITLTNLVVALLTALATIVLARNIPGLLEITILPRLPLDAGGRFAVTTIARYCVLVVGAVIGFQNVGLSWSKVQWLVAAMSVGLGFGLQEIFANFVSGLMLLFERPIRIGDTVTVGGVSGTVTRIRIRATTITDWDRKELIIPNKEFITGQVINWTLSDPVQRITVPVGIAYGADTERAEKLLYEVAEAEKLVLKEPEPRVLFLGFGDNSLNFELRVFIPSIEYLLAAKHCLHMAIDQSFRKAGIEIAFPQRDLHIRSVDAPIPVVTLRAEGEAAASKKERGGDEKG